MFGSEKFMSIDLMKEVLSEFAWPEQFELEDDLPDGIILTFPKSNFYFVESLDGDIIVQFLQKDTKQDFSLYLVNALSVLFPESERGNGPIVPGLVESTWPFPSEENARQGIRDNCKILLTHLRSVIRGDYSWVSKYLETRKNKALD